MAKKLTITDRILTGIFLMDKWYDKTLGAGNRAYWAGKVGFWTPPNYKGSLLSQQIYRLLRTGDLTKEVVNGEPVLTVGRGGKHRLLRKFSFLKMQQEHWDGYWRLVIFDISEKDRYQRDCLREKLRELGFGLWQKSIYISPYDYEQDVYEYLQEKKLLGKAFVLTARHKLMGEAKILAEKTWHLDKINRDYEKLLANFNQEKYLKILMTDPFLPRELLPEDWQGFAVQRLIKEKFKNSR